MSNYSVICAMDDPPTEGGEVIHFLSPSSTMDDTNSSQLPILQTPSKVISSDSFLIPDEFELPSSAIKKEVAKFCDEINQSDIDFCNDITVEETKLFIPDVKETITVPEAHESTTISETNDSTADPDADDFVAVPPNDEVKVVLAHSLKDLCTSRLKYDHTFQCGYCNHTTTTKIGLKTHMTLHLEHMPFICKTCNKGFLTQRNYHRHLKTPHNLGPYICQQCNKEFSSNKLLRFHISRTHNKVYKFQCSECDFQTGTLFELKRHSSKHWSDKPYKCTECPYQTHKKTCLDDHVTKHTDARPLTCPECGATFKTRGVLRRHQLTKHNSNETTPQHVCPHCKLSLSSSRRLNDHIRVFHKQNEPMYCKLCQETLTDKSAYMEHRKKRAANDPLRCLRRICPYRATTQCKLNAHMLRHNSTKVQTCIICHKEFSNLLDLKTHLYCHADLIKCCDCGGNFNRRGLIVVELTIQDHYNQDGTQLNNKNGDAPLDTEKEIFEDEPYVILEVLKTETEAGNNCVQYNLLRASEDVSDVQQMKENSQNALKDNITCKEIKNEMKVKCCNKVHRKIDVIERFARFIQNENTTPT